MTSTSNGHVEVTYGTVEDMAPALQPALLAELERALATGPVSVLFQVHTHEVPRTVPEFWLQVTRRFAPGLCAIAVVSESLAVRTAARVFGISNDLKGVPIAVKAFAPTELASARDWCQRARLTRASGAAPSR
ncbi:MAG: STAS/SEC14 domain-containing protein [Myxococcaceae bacterium]|nr:STAS/SEC14 domain-containing protein [Myxococcaceae bacterium]